MSKKYETVRIKFKAKERKMLEELMNKFGLSELDLASKFGVEQRTVQRWLSGKCVPVFGTRRYIAKVYNGYKSTGGKK